jgi:hypothetical protein
MRRGTKFAIAAAAAGAIVIGASAGIATAGGGDDSEPALAGRDLARASAAALDHTGGGRVTGTEVGDEESYYEVEVTLDDGRRVDVQLDGSFAVVGTDPDSEEFGDAD